MDKSYRFDFKDTLKWKEYLQLHGFVVIANYLRAEECR